MNHPRTGVIFPPSWTLQQKSSFLQSSSMEEFNLLYFTKIFPKLQQDFAWLKKNWSVGMLLYKLSSYCDAALTIYNEQNSSMYFREILMLLANPAFIKLYSHSEQNNRNSIVGECGQLSACARNYCSTSTHSASVPASVRWWDNIFHVILWTMLVPSCCFNSHKGAMCTSSDLYLVFLRTKQKV